jgi:dihydrofolate reductase
MGEKTVMIHRPDIRHIVAISTNYAIGKDGKIPWYHPEDLRRFREITMGHTLVMGRRTFESIGHPLEGRQNIVVSTTMDDTEGITIARNLGSAMNAAGEGRIYICGGESLYAETLPWVNRVELTLIREHITDADAFYPVVAWHNWEQLVEGRGPNCTYLSMRRRRE